MTKANWPLRLALALMIILVATLVLPLLLPLHEPNLAYITMEIDGLVRQPPYEPGEAGFILGTDSLGRDRLSRLIFGARYTLGLAALLLLARAAVGVPLGLLAGWYGGWLGRTVQSLSITMGSIPALVLTGLCLVGLQPVIVHPGTWLLVYVCAVVLVGFPRIAEHIRHATHEVSLLTHVKAARSLGAGTGRILVRHIMPLLQSDLLVMLSAEMAWILVMMGQLSIFGIYVGGFAALDNGLGLPSRIQEYWPEWGMMMAYSRGVILSQSWVPLLPGGALCLAAAAFHLLAEGLRLRWLNQRGG